MSSDATSNHSDDRGSNSESEQSDETESTRPNRWRGPSSTWLGLTKNERGLATSLDELRNRDLGVHLFNAHALKRKARETEEEEKLGVKREIQLQDDTKGFVPPKVWTAWPLPPEDVPRAGDEVGPGDGNEAYTLKLREKEWPSSELEDVLMATTLKFAKEKFQRRCSEPDIKKDMDIYIDLDQENEDEDSTVTQDDGDVDLRSLKSDSADFEDPTPAQQEIDSGDSSGSEESDRTRPFIKESIEQSPEVFRKPVVSTDDDRSRKLLRPSIRHTLSMLDEVLMALHHARNTCRQYEKLESNSEDDSRAASVAIFASEDLLTSGKKPRGRPRKFASLPNRAKTLGEAQDRSPTPSELLRAKKTHRGRPQKNYDRLEHETQQEYLVRIARIQKKSLPSFAPPLESSPSPSPSPSKRFRLSPAKRATKEELRTSRNKKLRLRDWSEVLGAAALVGFDPRVIDRASKRCAALFGEGMTTRTLIETPFAEPMDSVKTYQPDMIPNFEDEDSLATSEESGTSNEQRSSRNIRSKGKKRKPQHNSTSKPPRIQNYFCPVAECPRKVQGFRDQYSLKRHLQKGHRIAEEDFEEYLIPSDEEMDGAVHVDGFLRPIKPMKQLRKRSTKVKAESEEIDSFQPVDDHGKEHDVESDEPTQPELEVEDGERVRSESSDSSSSSSSSSEDQ